METQVPTILLVEDDPLFRTWFVSMLEKFGFQANAAADGAAGLESARTAPPDLIVLDILMPGLDGFAVCAKLKADPLLRDLPVIFHTSVGDLDGKLRAFAIGAVDFIDKGSDLRETLARIRLHLGLSRKLKAAPGPAESPAGPGAQPTAADSDPLLPALAEAAPDAEHEGGSGAVAQFMRRRASIRTLAQRMTLNLSETPNLEELARLAATNRTTLNREFQEAYGSSVFEWLREQRLNRAALLLRTTDQAVFEIAVSVGYESHAGFTKAFQQRFGVAPTEYRSPQAAIAEPVE